MKKEKIIDLVDSGGFTGMQLYGASRRTVNTLWKSLKSENNRPSLRRVILLAIKQEWRCYWCKQLCQENHTGFKRANSITIEHLTPVSQGGTNHPENLVMACHRCNNMRGSTPKEVFLQLASGFSVCDMPVKMSKPKKSSKKFTRTKPDFVVASRVNDAIIST